MRAGKKWNVGPNGEPIDGKRPGYLTWRHRSRQPQLDARARWMATKSPAAKREAAEERQANTKPERTREYRRQMEAL